MPTVAKNVWARSPNVRRQPSRLAASGRLIAPAPNRFANGGTIKHRSYRQSLRNSGLPVAAHPNGAQPYCKATDLTRGVGFALRRTIRHEFASSQVHRAAFVAAKTFGYATGAGNATDLATFSRQRCCAMPTAPKPVCGRPATTRLWLCRDGALYRGGDFQTRTQAALRISAPRNQNSSGAAG